MKTIFFALTAILFSIAVYSQTHVPPGPINGTWTLTGSPYLIEGETTIPNGSTLTIEPGVLVEWQGSYTMHVQGQILAIGTETDSIIFTAADTLSGWKSIRFIETITLNDTSRFEYCVFKYGRVYGESPDNLGGALFAINYDKFIVDHCRFAHNKALEFNILKACGGAIALKASSPLIRNSKFMNNSSLAGGAIFCWEAADPEIENNVFVNNTAIHDFGVDQGFGGAILCKVGSAPLIKSNTFYNNMAVKCGGALMCYIDSDPVIDHNLFYGNIAQEDGGAIEIFGNCSPDIINNTIANNVADGVGGGIDLYDECNPMILNTILWGNTANEGNQVNIWADDCVPDFYYSDIQGGKNSIGGVVVDTLIYEFCIDTIPMFIDTLIGIYHLTANSPCIDKGDPTMFDPDGTRCDIGAFYYDQSIGISEFKVQGSKFKVSCFPNPTQEISDIRYQISRLCSALDGQAEIRNVVLSVFDIYGQEIATLVNETQPAGEYTVHFDVSDLPAGLYLIRLQAGTESAVGKLVKINY